MSTVELPLSLSRSSGTNEQFSMQRFLYSVPDKTMTYNQVKPNKPMWRKVARESKKYGNLLLIPYRLLSGPHLIVDLTINVCT